MEGDRSVPQSDVGNTLKPPWGTVHLSNEELEDMLQVVWGNVIQESIFRRWCQGFVFSDEEPLALVQYCGGPCALIVPIQAFILKNVITSAKEEGLAIEEYCSQDKNEEFLYTAISEILLQCKGEEIYIVDSCDSSTGCMADTELVGGSNHPITSNCNCVEPASKMRREEADSSENQLSKETRVPSMGADANVFHKSLRKSKIETTDDVISLLRKNRHLYSSSQGLLLLLYSVVLTRGISRIRDEIHVANDALIDNDHGLGNQSLINLLLIGKAVPHVWNMNRNVDGLCLMGVQEQSKIGFLTILEDLKYCEVGSFLKSPIFPIWILGSETHLSIFFSQDESLAGPETPREKAIRIFNSFDSQENGFIASEALSEVLCKLDLCCDPDYLKIMRHQLDSESLGIILLKAFLEAFFPSKEPERISQTSIVFHYNGLRKTQEQKICFQKGTMVCTMSKDGESKISDLVRCLKTKWSQADVIWNEGTTVSLN